MVWQLHGGMAPAGLGVSCDLFLSFGDGDALLDDPAGHFLFRAGRKAQRKTLLDVMSVDAQATDSAIVDV